MSEKKANRAKKRHAMTLVSAVQAILRRWDPIGVEPGKIAPADEYDSYGPHIVSLVAHGCSVIELFNHLQWLREEFIGVEGDPERDLEFAVEILAELREHGV